MPITLKNGNSFGTHGCKGMPKIARSMKFTVSEGAVLLDLTDDKTMLQQL